MATPHPPPRSARRRPPPQGGRWGPLARPPNRPVGLARAVRVRYLPRLRVSPEAEGGGMATVEATPGTDVRVITEPEVYLLGRQTVDEGELDRFLTDHGVSWE